MDTWIGEECDIRPKKNRGAMPSQNEILKKYIEGYGCLAQL